MLEPVEESNDKIFMTVVNLSLCRSSHLSDLVMQFVVCIPEWSCDPVLFIRLPIFVCLFRVIILRQPNGPDGSKGFTLNRDADVIKEQLSAIEINSEGEQLSENDIKEEESSWKWFLVLTFYSCIYVSVYSFNLSTLLFFWC